MKLKTIFALLTLTMALQANLSTAVGYLAGGRYDLPGVEIDLEEFLEGFRAGFAGREPPMSQQEFELALEQLESISSAGLADRCAEHAERILAEQAKRADAVALHDGKIVYRTVKQGSGAAVRPDSSIRALCLNTTINGGVIGTTHGEAPILFDLSEAPAGLAEAVVGMRVGESRVIYVHPSLADPQMPMVISEIDLHGLE